MFSDAATMVGEVRTRSALRRDLERWVGSARPLPALAATKKAAAYAGVQAVVLLRLQIVLHERGHMRLARLVSMLNLRLTGAHFGVGCRIGPGLLLPHPQGIVVGEDVVIGEDCTIYHQVSIGGRFAAGGKPHHGHPTLGARVVVGLNAAVLGGLRVGDDATVGAHALVLRDVEPGDVVIGVPARSTKSSVAVDAEELVRHNESTTAHL